MHAIAASLKPHGLKLAFNWRRVLLVIGVSVLFGLLNKVSNTTATPIVVGRTVIVGLFALAAFALFEQWPQRLPRWLGRWALQLIGVVVSAPFSAWLAYYVTTGANPDFSHNPLRLVGFGQLAFEGVLFGPWIALGAIVRQRETFAREQALAFELERSELERQALDARLRLLQAQVEPHFLFNTLANVQELVDARSPQASNVLKSLIAYLRAAVPRLHEATTTLGQELQLVRAYLELMHMRIPDRLQFTLHIDSGAAELRCPPLTVLTLVENAVRHGIDPGEKGGHIEVAASLRDGRCFVRVTDTGIGLKSAGHGSGTGLSTLRERLQLSFRGDARLRLAENEPHGVCAELDFPAQRATP